MQPEKARRMGEAARQKALENSWSAIADRYAEFTQRVIASLEDKARRT